MKSSPASRLFAALLCLELLASCAVNPVTGRQNFVMMSESEEVLTGKKGDEEVRKQYGIYDNPALQRYVDEVGQRIAQKSHRGNLEYHFTVVDSPEINAFALPGGYIYITRGIMAYLNSEAELAAVLGHEIGHVTARHGVQQYSASMAASIGVALGSILVPELRGGAQDLLNLLSNALISGYGREHELEADRLGAEYLARAGYNPQAMVKVVGILKDQELFDAEIAREESR
jgi:predicted Zn-dependent protease